MSSLCAEYYHEAEFMRVFHWSVAVDLIHSPTKKFVEQES